MEESTATLLAAATEDELIVSQVLLDLRVMCSLPESLSKFNWSHRRRRSALDAPPPLSPAPAPAPSSPSRVVVDVQVKVEADVARMQVKGGDDEAKANTASPDTPLAFPTAPSESDDKKQFNHHSARKRSRREEKKKKKKKKCVCMIEELTQQRDVLRGEVEKVKQHYKALKAYNSELEAMRQKVLNSGHSMMELEGHSPQLEISRSSSSSRGEVVNIGVEYQTTTLAHLQPLIGGYQASHSCQFPFIATQMQSSSSYGLGSADHVGPLGIDLNISAEEALGLDPWQQPLDPVRASPDERARCAEARRMRSAKIKSRRRSTGSGNRLPRTR